MAGTMIACNGWLDVLLYASTRADIVFSEFPPGEETGLDTFAFMGKGHRFGNTTVIEAGNDRVGSRGRSEGGLGGRAGGRLVRGLMRREREESVEHLYGLDRIGIRGEVTVSSDVAQENEIRSINGIRGGEIPRNESRAWETRSMRSVKSGKSCEL